jgi:N-acetylglucosaminyldiphosphoundecaprenol N-acetyl-beta-D-mannosaminyltransferase
MLEMQEQQSMTQVCIPPQLDIVGVSVVPFASYAQALECVEQIVESNGRSFWVAINPIKVYHAWHNPELLNLLRQADVGVCDGVGISLASRLLYGRRVKRITGCDLFFKLISLAHRRDWSVYLLGASARSNGDARLALQRRYPGLRIVGWQDGYFEDPRKVVEKINASRADILFVALGSPRQEEWICHHRQAINAKLCMGVGGSFDVASGCVARAPKVFRKTGTEFLYRILAEPRKRWAHQKVLFRFCLQIIQAKLFRFSLPERAEASGASKATSE